MDSWSSLTGKGSVDSINGASSNESVVVLVGHKRGLPVFDIDWNKDVYKRVKNHYDQQSITAISDNEVYPPYSIAYDEIREIWRYHAHVVYSDARQQNADWLQETVLDMQRKLSQMEKKM